jgi:hypothetical protein
MGLSLGFSGIPHPSYPPKGPLFRTIGADDRQRELFTEAFKTITAAYAVASELQPQSSE